MPSLSRSIVVSAALVWTAAVVTLARTHRDVVIPRVPNPPLASDLANLPGDLGAIPVPMPANLGEFVRDESAARILGKALFWDMQVGSDGIQACATCHFRAGADPRSRNQVSPGLLVHAGPDCGCGRRTGAARIPGGHLRADQWCACCSRFRSTRASTSRAAAACHLEDQRHGAREQDSNRLEVAGPGCRDQHPASASVQSARSITSTGPFFSLRPKNYK